MCLISGQVLGTGLAPGPGSSPCLGEALVLLSGEKLLLRVTYSKKMSGKFFKIKIL